jgi:hypothetical protein
MNHDEFPRVCELQSLINDPGSYFNNFHDSIMDNPLKKAVWLTREQEFQRLDADSWTSLKTQALPYLKKKSLNGRGWQQLFDVLNQARAYIYLNDLGCSSIRFIPTTPGKTPDLEAQLEGLKVLCEVKTINITDDEAAARNNQTGGYTSMYLQRKFLGKLNSVLKSAKSQMENYEGAAEPRKIIYIIANFDDSLAEYKAEYYRQIDDYLAENQLPGIEIVFHNEKTAFHSDISMRSATVFNE